MQSNLKKAWTYGGAAAATLTALAIGAGGLLSTQDNEVRLITKGGHVVGSTTSGFGFKIPLLESTYNLRTDVMEITPKPLNISIQNGTITAQSIVSKAKIRLNGSQAERVETAKLIYTNMYDFHERLEGLMEKPMRDVIRTSVIVTSTDSSKDGDTNVKADDKGHPNFLNSQYVGELVAKSLQDSINSIIPGKVNIGSESKPQLADRIEVLQISIDNFEWDAAYKTKRQEIQDARANAEKAAYAEQEETRKGNGARAKAESEKYAEISRGEGHAGAILAEKTAEAEGLQKRIAAAGGVEQLKNLILAEHWNGSNATVIGGTPIVDARANDNGKKPTVVVPSP